MPRTENSAYRIPTVEDFGSEAGFPVSRQTVNPSASKRDDPPASPSRDSGYSSKHSSRAEATSASPRQPNSSATSIPHLPASRVSHASTATRPRQRSHLARPPSVAAQTTSGPLIYPRPTMSYQPYPPYGQYPQSPPYPLPTQPVFVQAPPPQPQPTQTQYALVPVPQQQQPPPPQPFQLQQYAVSSQCSQPVGYFYSPPSAYSQHHAAMSPHGPPSNGPAAQYPYAPPGSSTPRAPPRQFPPYPADPYPLPGTNFWRKTYRDKKTGLAISQGAYWYMDPNTIEKDAWGGYDHEEWLYYWAPPVRGAACWDLGRERRYPEATGRNQHDEPRRMKSHRSRGSSRPDGIARMTERADRRMSKGEYLPHGDDPKIAHAKDYMELDDEGKSTKRRSQVLAEARVSESEVEPPTSPRRRASGVSSGGRPKIRPTGTGLEIQMDRMTIQTHINEDENAPNGENLQRNADRRLSTSTTASKKHTHGTSIDTSLDRERPARS